ncbi:hypothetical protein HDV05_004758 [Chytridiales sp. JEL 0842]|nr:hypothetical protein HDV05_004758 [Chytridiales sp. JEL 0842]
MSSVDSAWLEWFKKHFPWLFPNPQPSEPTGPFNWKPCPNKGPEFQCGNILVPLDHLKKTGTNATISIAVARYIPTTNLNSKDQKPLLGTMFINPGGPGGSGVSMLLNTGPTIAKIVGNRFQILGFDPRGIARSNSVICSDSPAAHARTDLLDFALQLPGMTGSPVTLNGYAAFQEARAKACGIYSGDLLKYISTAYTARDIDYMREALGEETLNYWGFSYGTYLGITLVNMFPDRVGRVVIDGVTDPTTFSGRFVDWAPTSLVDLEATLDAFGKECEAAGPKRCALALDDTTTPPRPDRPRPIAAQIRNILKYLSERPLAVADAKVPTVIGGYEAGSLLFQALYSPNQWPNIAQAFADLIYRENATTIANMITTGDDSSFCPLKDDSGSFGFPAVKCNDGQDDHTVPLETWLTTAETVETISPLAGRGWTFMGLRCKYWPSRPVERYAGPWNKTLRNKILLIGNTYDPVTPLASAQLAEKLMGGNGVLLTHDSYGHCSLAMPGKCTNNAIHQYFVYGSLPEKGTVCKTDTEAFPDSSKSMLTLSDEYALVEEMKAMGEDVHRQILKSMRGY